MVLELIPLEAAEEFGLLQGYATRSGRRPPGIERPADYRAALAEIRRRRLELLNVAEAEYGEGIAT